MGSRSGQQGADYNIILICCSVAFAIKSSSTIHDPYLPAAIRPSLTVVISFVPCTRTGLLVRPTTHSTPIITATPVVGSLL